MSTPAHHYDLWNPENYANPHPLYMRMREEGPLVRLFEPNQQKHVWMATRYKEAVELLRDSRFSKDVRKLPEGMRGRYQEASVISQLNQHMLSSDPPDHTRLRSLVAKVFTTRRVEALRPRITAITHRLLDAMQERDSADLLDAFAFPLPVTVIAELLGVPVEDQDRFREWTNIVMNPPANGDYTQLMHAVQQFLQYFQDILGRRRAEPRDDLISALIAAEEEGDRLSPQEVLGTMFLLIIAGHETTVNLIGNGTLSLLRHPEQLERLRAQPELIESAVEEMLRYESPVECSTSRFTLEDTEFHGQLIPAGDMVMAGLLAANHDPEQFPEPERFDITREPNRHIAFGFGIHFCLGAPLARLEGTIALNALLERLPGLRLAEKPEALQWRPRAIVRGLQRLPVAW